VAAEVTFWVTATGTVYHADRHCQHLRRYERQGVVIGVYDPTGGVGGGGVVRRVKDGDPPYYKDLDRRTRYRYRKDDRRVDTQRPPEFRNMRPCLHCGGAANPPAPEGLTACPVCHLSPCCCEW